MHKVCLDLDRDPLDSEARLALTCPILLTDRFRALGDLLLQVVIRVDPIFLIFSVNLLYQILLIRFKVW